MAACSAAVRTQRCCYLDEGQLAEAGAALGVPDGDLAVVLDPPPAAQDVVHAGGDFVPLVVISKPAETSPFKPLIFSEVGFFLI